MTNEELSIQIVAINDAIQILARSETTVKQHNKEIDGLLAKTSKNDERLREIEKLIHQSCELKQKEIDDKARDAHSRMSSIQDKAFNYAWQFAGVVGVTTIGFFYYTFSVINTQTATHAEFEATQDEKADKIYSELFKVMRDIKDDVSEMRSELAVLKTNQEHYQTTLSNHMRDEEKKWQGIK